MAAASHAVQLLLLLALLVLPSSLALRIPASPLHVTYHNGPLLAGPQPLKLLLTFYGEFEPFERATLKAFLSSLNPPFRQRSLRSSLLPLVEAPSVASWWSLTQHFTDLHGDHVSQRVEIAAEADDDYSLGKHLKSSDVGTLATNSVRFLPDGMANILIIVLTSADVAVEGFCMHSCGGHSLVPYSVGEPVKGEAGELSRKGKHGMVPYVWVGNSKLQCPGFCAWPFARAQYGPPMEPLTAPNGVGVDGMIISLAKLLVNTATNPAKDGFYQGYDASFGLEAGGVCPGEFGKGAYPGYPGKLMQNPSSGASYNMEGSIGLQFLVPWIWDPASGTCAGEP